MIDYGIEAVARADRARRYHNRRAGAVAGRADPVQAAKRNQLQRSVNLLLGSALSTIGLTIPTMLAISPMTGTPLELGLCLAEAILRWRCCSSRR